MYRQCGRGRRNNDASRVRYGRIAERESAENMNRGCLAATSRSLATAASNDNALEK